MKRSVIPALLLMMIFQLITPAAKAGEERIDGRKVSIVFDSVRGTFSIVKSDGSPALLNARSEIIGTKDGAISTSDMKIESLEKIDINNALGVGRGMKVVYSDEKAGLSVEQHLSLYDDPEYVTVELALRSKSPFRIRRIIPVAARKGDSAGLFVGSDAAETQVLENGGSMQDMPVLDFYIDIKDGSELSASNWSACVYDRKSGASYMSGFLTNRKGLTAVKTGGGGGIEEKGMRAFNSYEAVTLYTPAAPIKKDAPFVSEAFFIDAISGNVFESLENFGRAVSKWTGKKLWDKPVPMGWNSWGGGAGSGGMGTAITEDIILKNLEAAAKFKKYGLTYFQIDDGYMITEGDWEPNENFPHGMKWLADRIREKGFKPGVWICAFLATKESKIWKEHPDWFAERSSIGKVLVPKEWEIIDFSNPGAKQWLKDLFTKVTKEWGMEWIKLDFQYWTLLGANNYDKTKTSAEIYTDAIKTVRDTIGPDVQFLAVSLAPLNSEYVDSVRITLDNEPWWDAHEKGYGGAGLKPTILSFQRRYYLHQSSYINHNDLIFFRESSDRNPRTGLKLNEARAFVSVIGLSGSIVKLGEPWVDMTPEWTYTLSRIMPPYGKSGRPTDLFDKEWAEVWSLPVTSPGGQQHHIVGLFNWGLNEDLATHEELPEETKEIVADLHSLGLEGAWLAYDFWDRKFLGEVNKRISKVLAPRTEAVVGLRKKTGAPQFLGTSRHITMGGTDLIEDSWDSGSGALTLRFTGTEDEPYEIAAYLPDGYTMKNVETSGNIKDIETKVEKNVLKINFKTTTADEISLKILCN